jgi:hypothetical protein
LSKPVKILITLAVFFVVSAVAVPKLLKSRKTDYTNLTWNEYRSPEKNFSISLPVAPKMSERTVQSAFGNASAHLLEAEINKDGGCMLLYADYPVEHINVSEETLYEMALKGATTRQKVMGVGSRKYVMVDGYRGVEAELKSNDPKIEVTGGVRIFWVPPRLYVVVAGGPNTDEFKAVQTRCLNSFRLIRNN